MIAGHVDMCSITLIQMVLLPSILYEITILYDQLERTNVSQVVRIRLSSTSTSVQELFIKKFVARLLQWCGIKLMGYHNESCWWILSRIVIIWRWKIGSGGEVLVVHMNKFMHISYDDHIYFHHPVQQKQQAITVNSHPNSL